ncbi:hypothetical protein [Nocardia asiatica]|uniref:hypothetical protein n=1 Tax=Nocardia asiatica TaxID=209252 RepID=UPI002456E9ED|nr:hypothetical protein [Nocardia asiatica]
MSKFGYTGSFSVTVEDTDALPDGMTQDDVWDSLRAALQSAAAQWYAANPGLVRSEPEVF